MATHIVRYTRIFILAGDHAGRFAIVCENNNNGLQVTLVGSTVHPDHFVNMVDDTARRRFVIPHGSYRRAPFSRAPDEERTLNYPDPQVIRGFNEADQRALRQHSIRTDGRPNLTQSENNPRIHPSMLVLPQGMIEAYQDAHLIRWVAERIVLLTGHDDVGARIHVRRWAYAIQAQVREIIGEFNNQRNGPRRLFFPVAGINDFEGEPRDTNRRVRRRLNDNSVARLPSRNRNNDDEDDYSDGLDHN